MRVQMQILTGGLFCFGKCKRKNANGKVQSHLQIRLQAGLQVQSADWKVQIATRNRGIDHGQPGILSLYYVKMYRLA